jgi:2-keto-4-pentenoate hydratase/2-oxohepta-3-ene-1,7-dioic acid hydratase in catechol pathway
MKIVGFESDNALRLGIANEDHIVDLQAVDPAVPDDLGEWLRRHGGDLKPLADLAKKAPASARRPLTGLKYALPVARPGKILCLGLNYTDHVKMRMD